MDEPNEIDWMFVSNDHRSTINRILRRCGRDPLPLLEGPSGIPTEADLEAWDRLIPGMAASLREEAALEMRRRIIREAAAEHLRANPSSSLADAIGAATAATLGRIMATYPKEG